MTLKHTHIRKSICYDCNYAVFVFDNGTTIKVGDSFVRDPSCGRQQIISQPTDNKMHIKDRVT